MSEKKQTNQKALKLGSYSVFLTLIVIAIVIVVNLMVGELPTTLTKFDTSNVKLYTLSDVSVQFIKNLKDDVKIYYVATSAGEDTSIEEMLARYASYSSRIKVERVDPNVNPTFAKKYTDIGLTDSSLIIESAKRSTVVDNTEIYTVEYTEEDVYYYYQTGQMPSGTKYFNGESCITTAIDYVTGDNLPKLYCLTGHEETALSETVQKDIKSENIVVEELSLLTVTAIPEDAGAVLINVPQKDLSDEETMILRTYLTKGGKLILCTYCENCNPEALPNILSLASDFGLLPEPGIILEGDTKSYTQAPYYLLPKLNADADLCLNLASTGITPVIPLAHGIKKAEETACTVEGILSTSDSAYVKTVEAFESMQSADDLKKKDGDPAGPFYVGASSSNAAGGTVLWYTSPAFLSDSYYSYNSELFMSNLTVLCDKQSSFSILGKAMQIQALSVSAASMLFWGILLVLILPVGIVVAGFVIWNKRRRR